METKENQAFESSIPFETRRSTRTQMTSVETALWQMLKGRRLMSLRFMRQVRFGPCVLGFYCPLLNLGIDIDNHRDISTDEADAIRRRQDFLTDGYGLSLMRFGQEEVETHIQEVWQRIHGRAEDIIHERGLSVPLV